MSNFWMAKFAALEDIAELIDNGAGTEGVLSVIQGTLDTPIEKNASEEDIEARLGIESVCYDFLKEASDYYATMNVACEQEALIDCLTKVAEDTKESMVQKGLTYLKDKGRAATQSVQDVLGGKSRIGGYGTLLGGAGLAGVGAAGLYGAQKLKKKYDERRNEKK